MIFKPEYLIGLCIFLLLFPLIHLLLIMIVFRLSEYINDKGSKKNIKD